MNKDLLLFVDCGGMVYWLVGEFFNIKYLMSRLVKYLKP